MGLTQKLGTIPLAISTDASNNIGIGGSPSGSYKLEVTGTGYYSGVLRVGAATGFAVGSIAGYRRIEYTGTTFSMLTNADGYAGLSAGVGTFSGSITMTGDNLVLNGTNTAIVFQNAGSTKGYNAIVTSTGAYVPGSIINDIIYRSNGNNFLWSVDSGSSCAMKLTSGGQLQIKQAANTHSGDGLTLYNTGNQYWNFVNGGDSNLYLGYGGTSKGYYSSSTGVYTALSDINKKKDFEESTIGLDAVLGLKPTLYRMKDDEETIEKHLGFIAQEVKEFIPQAYSESVNGEDTFIGLDYQSITATLVKAIQELSAQNQDLKSRLDKAGL